METCIGVSKNSPCCASQRRHRRERIHARAGRGAKREGPAVILSQPIRLQPQSDLFQGVGITRFPTLFSKPYQRSKQSET